MKHKPDELQELLCAPFLASEIEWRLQWNNDTTGLAVPYLTNRAIQDRLDEVVGPMDWKNEFKPWHHFIHKQRDKDKIKEKEVISQLCGIAIYHDERQEWVCKWDGAETSDIEPVKGGLSDSMKRAAVEWGMGRFLYKMDAVFVDVEKTKAGKTIIPTREYLRLDKIYDEMLAKIKANTPIPLVNRPVLEKGALDSPAPAHGPLRKQPAPSHPPAGVQEKPPVVTTFPTPAAPEVAQTYEVTNVVVQQGLNATNTHLFFKDPMGQLMDAFVQGVDERLSKGTLLTDIKLSQKRSGAITYYTVDSYSVLDRHHAA